MARLFQQYKTRLNGGHLSFCVTMPSRKRHVQPQDEGGDVVEAPEIHTCDLFPESTISPAFDPNRVLLRRVFFIGAEKAKYVSIGFYPTRIYQPLVELGGCGKIPLLLTVTHVRFLAEHLPRQITGLCTNEHYASSITDGLRINSTGTYRVARVYLGQQLMSMKLNELRHLNYILPMVIGELNRYTEAMLDVMNYVTAALYSDSYVEPPFSANKNVLYY